MRTAAAVVLLSVTGCAHAPPPAPRMSEPSPLERVAPRPSDAEELQVTGTLGSLSEDEIAQTFKGRWGEVSACLDTVQPRPRYLGGRVDLRVRVDKAGAPRTVWIVESSLGSWEVERCLARVTRGLQFPAPHGGPEAEFTYPIEARSTGAVASWDEGRAAPLVAKHRRDVTECKQRAANGLPPALRMTLYVGPGGKVTSAGLAADTPLDEELGSCLVQRSLKWRLDDPVGRMAKVTVGVSE